MSLIPATPTAATLALIRAAAADPMTLAERLGCTPFFAAGLIDAVAGPAGADPFDPEECPAVRAQYRDGLSLAEQLLDAERYAEGWDEAYAAAAIEAAQAAKPLPIPDSDIPW